MEMISSFMNEIKKIILLKFHIHLCILLAHRENFGFEREKSVINCEKILSQFHEKKHILIYLIEEPAYELMKLGFSSPA